MGFIKTLQARGNSSGALLRPAAFTSFTKRLTQLFLVPLIVLAVVVFSAVESDATVTGTTVTWHQTGENATVGPGPEFNYDNSTYVIDIDPSARTLTLSILNAGEWAVPSLDFEFSGGPLTQITSATITGGTAGNLSSYSASASGKTITIYVPYGEQALPPEQQALGGTVVVTFASLPNGGTAPSIVSHPSSSTITVGANTSFTTTASDATGYKWQVSTNGGGSFADISNGGVYSGATTATLNITAATIGMTGYQYRAVASGSTSPDATSNAATLTVNKAAPTIGVSASDSNPTFGTSVTLTATLSGGTSPTGTVEFFDGSTSLGTGTLSGTTASLGTSALTVGARTITAQYLGDINNAVATSTGIAVTVVAPTITVSPTTLSTPTVGASYSAATFSASGGTGPYTFAVTGGFLPAGMSLSNEGVLSGTPTAGGTFPTITVTATDDNGHTGTRDYTLSVNAPTISISPTSLPDGTVGSIYSTQTMSVSGGTAPYTFEFSGILPDGMTFDTATGEIGGTPTTQSFYSFTAKVTDSSTGSGPYSAQTAVSINIVTPAVVLSPADGTTLTAGQVGAPYSDTSISATGGSGTMDYSADNAADLPDGLSIDSTTGAITGTPTQAGTYTFTVWAAGTMGGATFAEYTIEIAPAAPTISVSASDSNPTFGASVTFTATLSGGASPTGVVTFKDGSTTLGTGTISGTTATLATSTLTAGSHSITAEYGGDSNNATAISTAITVTVASPSTAMYITSPADGSTLVAGSGNVTIIGQSIGPASAIAVVSVQINSSLYVTVTDIDGNFSIAVPDLTFQPGINTITATSSDATKTISVTYKAAPTLSVTSSSNTPTLGENVTFTATLAGGSSPSGDVEFFDGSTSLGTGTLSGTTATLGTSALTVGAHTITAKYLGDSNNAVATSTGITVTVGQSAPTISVSASDSNPALGASVTFTATLAGGSSPSGDVEFFDGSTSLGTGTLSGTTATLGTSALTVGSHTIKAVYEGDTNNASATSATITVTVQSAQSTPTLTLSANQTNPILNSMVNFTATLSNGASPTGTVTFKEGSTVLGTASVAGGVYAYYQSWELALGAHTIIAEYSGDANNAAATSAPITVTVKAQDITITPAAGTLTAGIRGEAYSQQFTVTGNNGPYTYTLGTFPPGMSINGTTGLFSGTPTVATTFNNMKVWVTDASNISTLFLYTWTVQTATSATPTVTVSASDSNPALGASVTFTATLAGGSSPTGDVEFFDGSTSLGTGTLSGTTATLGTSALTVGAHTITAKYLGDSNNTVATSTGITVTVGQSAPTISVSASDSNPALGASVTFTATLAGGSSPTGDVEFFDGSTSLGTGTLSGTTATLGTSALTAGAHTVTAKYLGDSNNAVATSTGITVTVTAPLVTFTFHPAAGTLPDGTVSTAYSRTVTATGGTGTVSYSVSGTLPAGLSLNPSTGEISGTPTTAGTTSFTIVATDSASPANTGSATYTLTVKAPVVTFIFTPPSGALTEAMAGEDYTQSISATGGTGALLYSLASGILPDGVVLNVSTGELTGPLDTDAEAKDYSFTIQVRDGNGSTGTASYILTVKPRAVTVTDKVVDVPAGSSPADVYLNRGATGGPFVSADMTFVEPAGAGTATIIRGQLAQAGLAATPVGWYLQFTPNPAYSGQVQVGFRLTSALGISNTGTVTYNIIVDAAKVAAEIDTLVRGFVQSRQNMIANTIKVPGLLERRQMSEATDPVTARMMPSESGATVSFATSLAQMESARDSADGVPGGYASPFNIWIDGAFLAHNDEDINGSKWGTFAMINTGADYLLTDKVLVGLSFHYDRMTDPTDQDAELTGNGWMAGPYASFEIGKGVFWNASLRYGGSSNDIDTLFWDGSFDTTRWMADTSIEGQWMLGDDISLTPKLRVLYFSETVDDYEVKNSTGGTIGIDGFNEEQFRVSLGAEIARSFTLESGAKLTPKLGVTGGFSGLDGAGAFGSVTAGLSLQTMDMWMLDASLLLNLDGDGGKSVGGRVRAGKTF
jgi:hypothetical protein